MFCNHYFLCFLFLIASNFLASKAQAQEELAIIPVRKASARTIRHFEIGDSVFITYRESSIDAATTRYNMVLPDRSVVPLNLPQLNKRDILTVLSHGDSLRFYFLVDVQREQVLKALVLNRYTGISRLSARSIPIPEALVGILGDTVLTINKRDSTLRIKLLTEMKLVNLRQIKIPAGFMNMQISRAVIDHGLEAYPAKAAASLKFYTHPDRLYITLDNVSATRDRGKSYVLHVDLTQPSATPVRYAIPYSPKGHFSSFLYNDLLYRVSKDRDGLYLQIFDSLANRVGYFTFNRPWKSSSNTAYIRGSDSKRVLDERTVWDAISNTMDVFVSVHPYDSSRVILKVGGHRAINGGGYVPIMVYSPITLAASLIANGIVNSATYIEESIDIYFYLIGNARDGFTYWKGEGLVGHSIDTAELYTSKKSDEYRYKGYMQNKKFTTAVYYKDEKEDALRIVRYPK